MKDHSIYNERLVSKSEILTSKKIIGNWDNELAVMMNRGKAERQYAYPESFMRMVAYTIMLYFRLSYRQMKELLRTYGNSGLLCRTTPHKWWFSHNIA